MTDYPDWTDPNAIAAAIATGNPGGPPGGVPLLHGQSTVLSNIGLLITPGGSNTSTLRHINVGYELFLGFKASGTDPTSQCAAELSFTDSVTGFPVDTIALVFWPGLLAAAAIQNVYMRGPTRGDTATLKISNLAAGGNLVAEWLLTQSGRPYAYDLAKPINSPASGSGRNNPSSDTETGVLAAHFINALGAGVSQVDQLPPYMGKCHIHFDTASNVADCEVFISAADDPLHVLTTGIVYDQFTDGTGNRDADIVLPGTQCFITVTNHNAAAKTCRYTITSVEY